MFLAMLLLLGRELLLGILVAKMALVVVVVVLYKEGENKKSNDMRQKLGIRCAAMLQRCKTDTNGQER